jgi:competence protein ComFC
LVLANGIGTAVNLPVVQCITTTRATTQLKGVTDPAQRKELVDGLYAVDPQYTAGKNVLLFDDLFRSGTTLGAITDVLLKEGKAASVRVLTITKTRSNQ